MIITPDLNNGFIGSILKHPIPNYSHIHFGDFTIQQTPQYRKLRPFTLLFIVQ